MSIISSMIGHHVAVLGLGKAGMAAIRALRRSDAVILAWDDDDATREAAFDEGVPIVDLRDHDFGDIDCLVLSPGIPLTHPAPHPVVERAIKAGCEIFGEAELMARTDSDASFIGVTGTNGKSTTTALIGHILREAGMKSQTGGNLGIPALDLEPLGREGAYVLEMSSYQLDLTKSLVFNVAVLLNLTPDHLDRHGNMESYIAAKKRIFNGQTADKVAIIGIDDPPSRKIFKELKAKSEALVIPISAEGEARGGVYIEDGKLINDIEGRREKILDLRAVPALPGQHNGQNAAAAFAACRAAGLPAPVIANGIRGFSGLPHRQESVATIGGVSFVNDSKATNANAAAKALACYQNIYWIVGGEPKSDGIESLAPLFKNIRHAFLIGKAAKEFDRTIGERIATTTSGDLAHALGQATALAQADLADDPAMEPVILFSPACASFDQWRNFEERGDAFRKMVLARAGDPDTSFDDIALRNAAGGMA